MPRSPKRSWRRTSVPARSEGNVISQILLTFAQILIQVLTIAIFARSVLSWFPIDAGSPLVRILNEVTEPVLGPLRRIVPRLGMIDITPMVAIVVLVAIGQAISKAG